MKAEIVNGQLIITIPLQTPQRSASGKTIVIATTRGNQKTALMYEGKPVTIGVNAYYSA